MVQAGLRRREGATMTDAAEVSGMTRTEELLEREARHAPGLWKPDIVFTHGEGVFIYDAEGRRYYDCMAGIAVASLGHAHPRLIEAIATQAGRLIICSQSHGNDTRTEFLEELFSFVQPPLQRAFMASSGSEVNEAALKWARVATGRRRFGAARRGFSGRTMGALSLTWEPKYREPFMPTGTEVTFIDYNSVEQLEEALTDEVAALLLEPIQGEGGINEAEPEFLERARELTRERGALLIMDEIQTGVGRTGRFLATERYGVEPDMVTLAKGLGGGVPVAALLMTDEVARAMPSGGHGTTFGGNALAAAAGLAVLRELRSADLLGHVGKVGRSFREALEQLDSPLVKSVKGRGLLLGLELTVPAAEVMKELRDLGVLTINAGDNVIRLVPPLIISEDEAAEVASLIGTALARVS